jgi:hypothetical protein
MKPGTSARKSSGRLKALQVQMKRAALSAESTNRTPPVEPSVAHDQLLRPPLLDLQEGAAVHHGVDQLDHVERLVLVLGDELAQGARPGRLLRRRRGRLFAPALGKVGEVALRNVDPLLV